MRTRVLLALLAISPLIVFAFAYALQSAAGSLFGDLLVFGPLAALGFYHQNAFSKSCIRTLRLALACGVLLVPVVCMQLATEYSVRYGQDDSKGIYLVEEYPPRSMGGATDGSALIYGLNVRGNVLVWKWDATSGPHVYGAQVWTDIAPNPPHQFKDENGNGLSFSVVGLDSLRFQDDRGGFAEVKWDGKQFVITASSSVGRSAGGRSPSQSAQRMTQVGSTLIQIPAMLAWLMVTWFGIQRSRESAWPNLPLMGSAILQLIGLVAVLWLAISPPPQTSGDIPSGEGMLIFLAFGMEFIALLIMGVSLVAYPKS